MRKASKKNPYYGFKVRKDRVEVNLLQYADDTLFVGEASLENVMVIKSIMCCYEVALGLKVNFNRSCFSGVGVDWRLTEKYVELLNYRILEVSFVYWGIPIRANPRRLETWEPIIGNSIKKILSLGNILI